MDVTTANDDEFNDDTVFNENKVGTNIMYAVTAVDDFKYQAKPVKLVVLVLLVIILARCLCKY